MKVGAIFLDISIGIVGLHPHLQRLAAVRHAGGESAGGGAGETPSINQC